MPPRNTDERLKELLWDERVVKDSISGCWHWTGYVNATGYGKIGRMGSIRYAHRISYELANGPFDDDWDVLHACDCPNCVNPAHLHLGTHSDNIKEMYARGRSNHRVLRGDDNPISKLTGDEVREMRRLYATGDYTLKGLAVIYRTHFTNISLIVRYKTWTDAKYRLDGQYADNN